MTRSEKKLRHARFLTDRINDRLLQPNYTPLGRVGVWDGSARARTRPAGIILAAGASTRAGSPKALFTLNGVPLLRRVINTLRRGGCDPIIVVLGAHLHLGGVALDAQIVQATDWRAGMRASLRAGLRAAPEGSVLICPVDCPAVQAQTVRALVARADRAVWVPTFQGRLGHPIRLPRWAVLRAIKGDGTRLDRLFALRTLPTLDASILDNVNTADDMGLLRLRCISAKQ